MNTIIETRELPSGHVVEIHVDTDACNPRKEWDNLGTLAIRHIGDEEPDPDFDLSDCIWLPVYRYEHSGTALATKPFHCPWDSALTGYIYVTKARVREEWKVRRISERVREMVLSTLRSEVETYHHYISGQVYGYILKDTEGEEVDSCWGFFGEVPEEEYLQ